MSLEDFCGRRSVRPTYLMYLPWTQTSLAPEGEVQSFSWNPLTHSKCQFNTSQCPCFWSPASVTLLETALSFGYQMQNIQERVTKSSVTTTVLWLMSPSAPRIIKKANAKHILMSASQFCCIGKPEEEGWTEIFWLYAFL